MAIDSTEQYKPLANERTADNDNLDVGAVRDLAESLNNYIFNVCRFPMTFASVGTAGILTDSGGTFQRVYGSFAAREFGPQFDKLAYAFGHEQEAGSGDVLWTVYCGPQLYQGPEGAASPTFDTAYLGLPYSSITFSSTSTTHAFARGTDLTIVRNAKGLSYITITGAADESSTTALIRSFTLSPYTNSQAM